MEAKKRISQPMMGALAGAGLVVGIGLALHIFRVGLGLIHWSYDLPFAVRANIGTDEAVLIYMDDASHAALQQPFNTAWSRARCMSNWSAASRKPGPGPSSSTWSLPTPAPIPKWTAPSPPR